MSEQQMKREVEKLIRENRLPSLQELTQAILKARMKYANKIRRARREGK
jgi:hypothetical protein